MLAGPGLGGYLVQLLTAPVAVLVDAASFLVSAVLVGRVRAPERVGHVPAARRLAQRDRRGPVAPLAGPAAARDRRGGRERELLRSDDLRVARRLPDPGPATSRR